MVNIDECSLALVPELEHAPANPDPSSISPDAWGPFETAALGVMGRIQPTVLSEARRAAVVDYIQRLVRCSVGCEVFPFGSVPLKTYLPDGDIDLAAFGSACSDESLANEVRAILESEERRKDAEFEVKDVQYINAEVKLVKCFVQNIVVDISFHQIGGLCTLCFLEQVDQRFEKNHLFKRSIMLIKAWCYYESRILGAHHGLISTYALETLVLYIFHLFHKSLDGPLAVLYRFLDYYSKFDWDNKGISLYGPISLSSLPELVINSPGTHDDCFLEREEILKQCAGNFTVPPSHYEKNTRPFSRKFLNIVDPLKQGNNLGRSVSKGNFYRIRSAFDLGARKLGKILQAPVNSVLDEVNQFFRSTLKRNHSRVQPDVQDTTVNLNIERHNNAYSTLYSSSFGDLSDQFNSISISDSSNHESQKQEEHNSEAEHQEKSTSHLVTNPSISILNGMSTKGYKEVDGDGGTTIENLSDLTGDYRTNFNNLLYSQSCHQDYPVHQVYYPILPAPPVHYQNKQSLNGHNRKNPYGHASRNGIIPGPYSPGYYVLKPFYQTDVPMQAHEAVPYFPNPNLCMEAPPTGRGERRKNYFPRNNHQKYHRYGRGHMPADMNHSEELRQQPPVYVPVTDDHGIPSPLKISTPSSHAPRDNIHGSGFIQRPDSKLEFGTLGALPLEVRSASQDQANRTNSAADSKPSAPMSSRSPAQNPEAGYRSITTRDTKPYHLKDNGDFPPLSS